MSWLKRHESTLFQRSLLRSSVTSLWAKFNCSSSLSQPKVCWDPDTKGVQGGEGGLPLTDVNMVAQLLKAFFRELPEPLIPFE